MGKFKKDGVAYRIEPVKNEEVQQIRSKINNILHEVHSTILASGIAPNIYYSPPPAIGGIAGWIGVVNNIFNLHSLEIDHRHLIDFIERSIGIYKRDKIKAFLRTINPFYWIVLLLDFIVSIPFKILGKLGFNQEKLESSFFGKLIKGVLYLVTVFAAFLTILEKLGYLEWFKKLIFK